MTIRSCNVEKGGGLIQGGREKAQKDGKKRKRMERGFDTLQ